MVTEKPKEGTGTPCQVRTPTPPVNVEFSFLSQEPSLEERGEDETREEARPGGSTSSISDSRIEGPDEGVAELERPGGGGEGSVCPEEQERPAAGTGEAHSDSGAPTRGPKATKKMKHAPRYHRGGVGAGIGMLFGGVALSAASFSSARAHLQEGKQQQNQMPVSGAGVKGGTRRGPVAVARPAPRRRMQLRQ